MKKTLLIAAVALFGASVFAQTVTSANIVGYVKIDTIGDAFAMPSGTFMVGTGNTITEVLGDALPVGSTVYTWNGSGYDTALQYTYYGTITPSFPSPIYTTNGVGWVTTFTDTPSSRVLPVGEGFWVKNGGSAGTTNTVTVAGEVVVDAIVTNTIAPSFNLIASPYAADVAITDFGFNATVGDKIYTWNGSGYDTALTYTYYGTITPSFPSPIYTTNGVNWVTTFTDTPTTRTVAPGAGFWYDSTAGGNVDWVMTRPFSVD